MSKDRAELKSAIRSLEVSRPLRIPPQLGFTAPKTAAAPEALARSASSNTDERGSKLNPVHFQQGSELTGSQSEPVQIEPTSHEKSGNFFVSITGSRADTVQNDPDSPVTGSTADMVKSEPSGNEVTDAQAQVTGRAPFTAVPNFLLRDLGRFADPIDFMIYLHLFTYSHGFGRKEANMSIGQLERFTGVARNTVRRSLERLTAQGLLRCVGEYEHARMSRRYRVSIPDPVRNEPCSDLTGGRSNLNPVTGSKSAPYKESIHKENPKNSLSQNAVANSVSADPSATANARELPEKLENYLAALKPERKRQSEHTALCELLGDFAAHDIAAALTLVVERGTPGSGEPVHSPLAFLASGGITRVLAMVREERSKREQAEARKRAEAAELERKRADDVAAEREAAIREAAFLAAFQTADEQQAAIAQYRGRFPGLSSTGPVMRAFAIDAWWAESKNNPKSHILNDTKTHINVGQEGERISYGKP